MDDCRLEQLAIMDVEQQQQEEEEEEEIIKGRPLTDSYEEVCLLLEEEEEEEIIKVSPLTNSYEEVSLDSSIWSNLPSDIFERVVAHLPVVCLAKLRTVSKKLNQTILSDNFLNTQADLPCREAWIAMFEADSSSQFCAYDPSLNTWYQIPLSFLPCQVNGLASAGGLLCCKGEINGSLSILICNPITKHWTLLPPMIKKRLVPIVSMQLVTDHTGKGFKVIVAGDDLLSDGRVKDLSCEIFDSRTERWGLGGPIPPKTDLELGSAICNGNLYLISCNPYGAVSFNLQESVWTKLQAPMPRNLTIPSLVECSGRLFMVGGIAKKNLIGSIRVWELCENAMAWKEVARLKEKMFKELSTDKGSDLYFTAVGHGNLIYFSFYQWTQMLALNIHTRFWFWLPHYPATGASQGKLFGYPFTPNLYTSVS